MELNLSASACGIAISALGSYAAVFLIFFLSIILVLVLVTVLAAYSF